MMSKTSIEFSGLTSTDAEYLSKVQGALPIIADLFRADLLLFVPGNQPNTAVIVTQVSPHTVSSVFASPMVGRQVGRKNEPLVFQAFRRGLPFRGTHASPPRGMRTLQEVHPLFGVGGSVVAVLSLEGNFADHERLKKRKCILRKALEVILGMAKAGQLDVSGCVVPIGGQEGLVVLDAVGEIRYASRLAESLYVKLGFKKKLVGCMITDVDSEASIVLEALEQGRCVERETNQQDRTWIKKAIPLISDDSTSWLSCHRGLDSRYGGVLLSIDDVTEQRQKEQALRLKSAMIQEVHHRVKNNLQTIAALLRLQARRTNSVEVETILNSGINRILSIAVVHEFLSNDQDSVINVREVCQRILDEVTLGVLDPDKNIALKLEGTNLYLPAQQATSCALIVNELLQNAVKHGYEGRTTGTVIVRLADQGDDFTIEIADDGIGLPESFERSSNAHLGLQIINSLVQEDLKGRFDLGNGHGVTARISFPRLAAAPTEVATLAYKLQEEGV